MKITDEIIDRIIEEELQNVIQEEEAKKDACYKKIKAAVKRKGGAWPSAYASGRLVQCRKKGAANWREGEPKDESVEEELDEKKKKKKPCKPSKGKRFAKRVDGKCRSYGQSGKAKGGGDRIRPGTKKADAYCARSAKIKKCKNPPCANTLSRKKWKCKGSKSKRAGE